MKIPFRDIENFVKNPQPYAKVILVYGPDSGLVKERTKTMGLTVAPDLDDPFNVIKLNCANLLEDTAKLSDEANAMSMMGGKRLIRVDDATDKLTPQIKSYLENPNDDALIILQAGELTTRSSLRKLCEGEKNAAALPCYVEDERDLSRLIQTTLQEQNYQIDRDAVTWLAANLQGDRARVRSELEKLMLYTGQAPQKITLDTVITICGQAGEATLDKLLDATGTSQAKQAMQAYSKLMQEGTSFVLVLRSLQNHFKRLHLARAVLESGGSSEHAMKSLSPPIFFKQQAAFKHQLEKWRLSKLNRVLMKLSETEEASKQTGAPTETLCAQTILGISSMKG